MEGRASGVCGNIKSGFSSTESLPARLFLSIALWDGDAWEGTRVDSIRAGVVLDGAGTLNGIGSAGKGVTSNSKWAIRVVGAGNLRRVDTAERVEGSSLVVTAVAVVVAVVVIIEVVVVVVVAVVSAVAAVVVIVIALIVVVVIIVVPVVVIVVAVVVITVVVIVIVAVVIVIIVIVASCAGTTNAEVAAVLLRATLGHRH